MISAALTPRGTPTHAEQFDRPGQYQSEQRREGEGHERHMGKVEQGTDAERRQNANRRDFARRPAFAASRLRHRAISSPASASLFIRIPFIVVHLERLVGAVRII